MKVITHIYTSGEGPSWRSSSWCKRQKLVIAFPWLCQVAVYHLQNTSLCCKAPLIAWVVIYEPIYDWRDCGDAFSGEFCNNITCLHCLKNCSYGGRCQKHHQLTSLTRAVSLQITVYPLYLRSTNITCRLFFFQNRWMTNTMKKIFAEKCRHLPQQLSACIPYETHQ